MIELPTLDIVAAFLRTKNIEDRPADREAMICRLRSRGIQADILRVMSAIPRHAFFSLHRQQEAYNEACRVVTGDPHVLTTPYGVAWMTQNLMLDQTKTILEVGTGTGYQTCILSPLVRRVYTVECVPHLVCESGAVLNELGLGNVKQKLGDGSLGWAEEAPFDAILLTAAARTVPAALVDQLCREGGKMVLPVVRDDNQRLLQLTRYGDCTYTRDLGPACFVRLQYTRCCDNASAGFTSENYGKHSP